MTSRGTRVGMLSGALLAAALAAGAWAQPAGQTAGGKAVVSPAAEAAALDFAREHHPELASLLDQLQSSAPKEYQAAIADLSRTRERLERSREKTPERYALELAEWKVNSRIRLLAARMAMGGDTSLEAELKAAVRERFDLRLQLQAEERERLSKRLERLDEQIAEQRRKADELIERDFATLRKGATSAAVSAAEKKNKPKPDKADGKSEKPKAADRSPAGKGAAQPLAKPSDKPAAGKKNPAAPNRRDGDQGGAPSPE